MCFASFWPCKRQFGTCRPQGHQGPQEAAETKLIGFLIQLAYSPCYVTWLELSQLALLVAAYAAGQLGAGFFLGQAEEDDFTCWSKPMVED